MREATARCRSCGSTGLRVFLDLGKMPLPDALLTDESLGDPEPVFPLEVAFCSACTLVQILEEVPPEMLFVDNYLYFSSFSDALLRHAREHAFNLIRERKLDSSSFVVEIASNDGYLLRNFARQGIPVLGIDPAPQQAKAAAEVGVPTLTEFFDASLAERLLCERGAAAVIVANNVMAHVPDLNGFVEGLSILLADDGVATIENPYVRDLIANCEFDTIYHEHFCYFSCTAVDALVRRHGLFLNDVEYFPKLHGGTLRWHVGRRPAVSRRVETYLADEERRGLTKFDHYSGFGTDVDTVRSALVSKLEELKDEGSSIAAYGAAAKGSTLLNYAGVGPALVDFVVDRNSHKQGKYMPGVHIPIRHPSALLDAQPDYVLLLAWNFRAEIVRQQREYRRRGGQFIIPVPTPQVI